MIEHSTEKNLDSFQGYYSSSDSISFGPITLREVKRNLRNPLRINKPSRRYSDSHILKAVSNIEEIIKTEKMDENTIKSSGSTDYYTANETVTSTEKTENVSRKKEELQENSTCEIIELSSDDSFENIQYNFKDSGSEQEKYSYSIDNSLAIGAEMLIPHNNSSFSNNDIAQDISKSSGDLTPYEDSVLDNTMEDIDNLFQSSLEISELSNQTKNDDVPKNVHPSTYSNIPVLKLPTTFKVPKEKPKVSKHTPNKGLNKGFGDIISPVRLYIHNSPAPLLRRKLTPEKPNTRLPLLNITPKYVNKPNIPESLPFVRYKPSTNKVECFNKVFKIPDNIKNLIVVPTVTKHDSRTNVTTDAEVLDAEVSVIQQDDRNVSFYTNQYAFKY